MKLWVDDLRDPPDDSWTIARNSRVAVACLQRYDVTEMSLDHDLGGEDTSRVIIIWLCHEAAERWPAVVHVHSANPVGAAWLRGMIERYHPDADALT